MVELKVKSGSLGTYCIMVDNDIIFDRDLANQLYLTIDDYKDILKFYGASDETSNCGELYFKTKEEAQACIDYLNKFQDKEKVNIRPTPKPPLGVLPRNLFEEQRILELSRALYEYISVGNKNYTLLTKWAEEIQDRVWNLKCASED